MENPYDRAGYHYNEVSRFIISYQPKLCPEGRSRCPPQVWLLSSGNKKRDQKPLSSFLQTLVRDGHNFEQTVADSNRNASCVVIDCLDSLKFITMQFFSFCKIEICISTSYISF